jgi:protein SCO1/2
MKMQRTRWSPAIARLPAVAALLAALALAPALAHDAPDHAGPAPARAAETVKLTLQDLELVDQDGRPLRFRSEALGDRIVAIDFIYTTCTTICPVLSSLFAEVQDRLGERLGRELWLISISVDPIRDTPRRLRAYARKFGSRPGWIWLTGAKPAVDKVLVGLGAYTAAIEDHPPMFLIGDAGRGRWTRLNGFPDPGEIVERLDQLRAMHRAAETN